MLSLEFYFWECVFMIDENLDYLFADLESLDLNEEGSNDFIYEDLDSSEIRKLADKDVVFVKLKYNDNSTNIFRGTYSQVIADSLNLKLEDSNLIINTDNKTLVDISGCEVSYYLAKPEYERRLDEFANQFI